jgi:FecR protein
VHTKPPNDPQHSSDSYDHPKIHRVEVYWTAVTYKTVIIYGLLILAIILAGTYIVFPSSYASIIDRISNRLANGDPEGTPVSQTQAKFVNLDGKVQVKKVNSVQWVEADYRTSLDKGDLVQTGTDGAARISFADGTNYTVKSNTLITVEQNAMASDRPKESVVRINVGNVDLTTPSWTSSESKAVVRVEDASAQARSNSRLAVKADPNTKESEFVVANGSAQVQRGNERVELNQWEKASMTAASPITKSAVLAPPELLEPLNLAPIIAGNPKTASLHFEWKPVPQAVSYTLRISTTNMFTKIVKEAPRISGTSVDLSGLDAGDYFWNVIAVNNKKVTSEVSDTYKFTLVAQGKSQEMMLEIQGTQLQGRVVEIFGKTEPGAALIINGQHVPNIAADGTFRYFTDSLQPGEHTIVIIGQNRRGGTNQKQVSIVVPN